VEDAARVVDLSDSAADRQGNEDLARGAGDDVDHGLTIVAGCGDVEEYQLVSALIVVAGGELDGIAGVAQAYEVDALYDAAAGYVEAGDDSLYEHRKFLTMRIPTAPDFSG